MRNFIFIALVFFGFSCASDIENKEKTVTIAVANNMLFAVEEISHLFQQKHRIKVQISSGSSGTLTTQIKQGAPFDIFISANMKYPNKLFEEGLAMEAPKVYANGALILWTLNEFNLEEGINVLLMNEFKKIAIANPETAPYGIAAVEAMKKANLYNILRPKLIWGEGIGQVNQYIKSKAVDAGITSKSVLFAKKITEKGNHIEIDKSLYEPIHQGIVLLKSGKEKNLTNAELFYNFMFSEETKSILTKFGYEVK
jgi:molybdate transport system substrate-binding protein